MESSHEGIWTRNAPIFVVEQPGKRYPAAASGKIKKSGLYQEILIFFQVLPGVGSLVTEMILSINFHTMMGFQRIWGDLYASFFGHACIHVSFLDGCSTGRQSAFGGIHGRSQCRAGCHLSASDSRSSHQNGVTWCVAGATCWRGVGFQPG